MKLSMIKKFKGYILVFILGILFSNNIPSLLNKYNTNQDLTINPNTQIQNVSNNENLQNNDNAQNKESFQPQYTKNIKENNVTVKKLQPTSIIEYPPIPMSTPLTNVIQPVSNATQNDYVMIEKKADNNIIKESIRFNNIQKNDIRILNKGGE